LLRDDVAGKRITNDLRVVRADGFRRVEARVRVRTEGVVDGRAAQTEVAVDFTGGGHGVYHRHGLSETQALVVGEEEAAVADDWAAEASAEIVSHKMIRRIHLVEGARVERVVA